MAFNSLDAAIRTPALLLQLIADVNFQKRFINKHLGAMLEESRLGSDGTLDDHDFKKIYKYYGLAVPAILGEALAILRGRKLTERERLALTYQGAMTGLFDDFFDKHEMPEEMLKNLIETPDKYAGKNSSEQLFLHCYRKSLEYSANRDLTCHYLQRVYHAQVDSKKQALPGLSKDEIRKITIEKGGVSVLFYRSALSHPLDKIEEEALYHMGGLMQLGNDLFDVYKDSLKDIHTLITTCRDITSLRREFDEIAIDSYHRFYKTCYPKKNVRRFLSRISMSLTARCYVCFDQLKEKEKLNNGEFLPGKLSREDLVCDLDRPKNKYSSVLYHITRLPRLL